MTKKAKHFSRWKWGWGHQGLVTFGIAERKCWAIGWGLFIYVI